MLRGSSILFSGSFINRGNFYLKNDFINKIYYYYLNRGLSNIVLNDVVSILISSFTLFLIIFMINCIDYTGIIGVENDNEREDLTQFINTIAKAQKELDRLKLNIERLELSEAS